MRPPAIATIQPPPSWASRQPGLHAAPAASDAARDRSRDQALDAESPALEPWQTQTWRVPARTIPSTTSRCRCSNTSSSCESRMLWSCRCLRRSAFCRLLPLLRQADLSVPGGSRSSRSMQSKGEQPHLIYTALYEAFFTYLKVGLLRRNLREPFRSICQRRSGCSSPPASTAAKRRAFRALPGGHPGAVPHAGAALAYYFVFPFAWRFFLSFETPGRQAARAADPAVQAEGQRIPLALVMKLIMAFGIAFQLPVLLTLCAQAWASSRSKGAAEIPPLCVCRMLHRRRRSHPAGRDHP